MWTGRTATSTEAESTFPPPASVGTADGIEALVDGDARSDGNAPSDGDAPTDRDAPAGREAPTDGMASVDGDVPMELEAQTDVDDGSSDVPLMNEAELEQRIATYLEALGYESRTDVVLDGRSGEQRQIDVLGEKSDALATFRLAVDCDASDEPIGIRRVEEWAEVLTDAGIHKGIVATVGGYDAEVEAAAALLDIDLWDADVLAERLAEGGSEVEAQPAPHQLTDVVFTGLEAEDAQRADAVPAAAEGASLLPAEIEQTPRRIAHGVPFQVPVERARTLINKEARGRLGMSAENVVWAEAVWLPVAVVQIALSRVEGRVKKVAQMHRLWNAYELVDGQLVASWNGAPVPVEIDLGTSAIRARHHQSQAIRSIREVYTRLQAASTEAAHTRYRQFLAHLGIPPAYAVTVESVRTIYLPEYAGILQRKGGERVVVVDGLTGRISTGLSNTLSLNIHWLRESLR